MRLWRLTHLGCPFSSLEFRASCGALARSKPVLPSVIQVCDWIGPCSGSGCAGLPLAGGVRRAGPEERRGRDRGARETEHVRRERGIPQKIERLRVSNRRVEGVRSSCFGVVLLYIRGTFETSLLVLLASDMSARCRIHLSDHRTREAECTLMCFV